MYKKIHKDKFIVIGKIGRGPKDNSTNWIIKLWDEAGSNFIEIEDIINKDGKGGAFWWGIMDSAGETINYMVGCETALDVQPPDGWDKWVIPAQSYVTAECTPLDVARVYNEIINDPDIKNIGLGYEFYSKPDDVNFVEVYVPIAN